MKALIADIARTYAIHEGGPVRKALACIRKPGVHAVVALRFGQWLLGRKVLTRVALEPVYAVMNLGVQVAWGIEIPRRATIGPGLDIAHSGGIVVSAHAVIGKNCNLSQGTTIGVAGDGGAPVIGDDVYIGPGAKLIGGIRVGNNVKIGANAVVHKDLPDNAIAALSPGFKILSMKGNRAQPSAPPRSDEQPVTRRAP
jgi:serine O-acetyltransferase